MVAQDKQEIPDFESVHDLPYGVLNAGLIELFKELGGAGGRVFRSLRDHQKIYPGPLADYSSCQRVEYYNLRTAAERAANLLRYNGVRHCLAWEDVYQVIPHLTIEKVEELLDVKFTDEQKLGPLRRVPYYESTLINSRDKILVPVYPLNIKFLTDRFPGFFDCPSSVGRLLPELLAKRTSCCWLLFSRSAGDGCFRGGEELERIRKNPLWVQHEKDMLPTVAELIYFCVLYGLAQDEQHYRCLNIYYRSPVARSCDLTPDGEIIGVTLNDERKIHLEEINPYTNVGDYPLVKPDVSSPT